MFNTECFFNDYVHTDTLNKEPVRFNTYETLNALFYIYTRTDEKKILQNTFASRS